MFDKIKIKIKFEFMKIRWKQKNKNNFTAPKHLCDVSKIEIGDYTYGGIDAESFGCENAHLTIGKFCSIAQNVRFILDGEHNYKNVSTYPFKVRFGIERVEALCRGPIIIEDDVWIGERSVILSGVHIGKGAVIGAGSVVRKDVPPYAIYVGDKVTKYRFSHRIIEKLKSIDYSNINSKNFEKYANYLYQEIDENNIDEIVSKINGI